MAKKEEAKGLEDEIEIGDIDFESPIDAPVIERSYNKVEVDDTIGDIPEPDFVNSTPTFEEEMEEQSAPEPEPSPFDNVTNPAMENLDKKERKEASSQLVTTVLDAYEMIHPLFAKIGSINESKVQDKILNGEINPELSIPISEDGTSVNALEYAQTYNEQVKEAVKYAPEFGEKVRPAMERVFAKKGWGMTDEQYLMVAFGKDLAVKATMMIALRKQGNEMIKNFAKFSKQQPVQPQPEVVTPDSYERPTKQEKPKPKQEAEDVEEVVITAEDIEKELSDEN